MKNWEKIESKYPRRTWEKLLEEFPAASPFQNFEWGEAYRGLGWTPEWYVLRDEDKRPISAAMVLIRRVPFGFGFAWLPGGPVSGNCGEEIGLLPNSVKEAGGFRGLFFRGRFENRVNANDAINLSAGGWHRSIYSMGSQLSMELDLTEDTESFTRNLSKNWKRNLKRSQKNGLTVRREFQPDTEELRQMYAELEKLKGVGELCSKEKIEQLFGNPGSNFVYVTCRDSDGTLIGFRAALVQGRNGLDYLSATTSSGRDKRASFVTMWELLEICRSMGVEKYDMGGIDPLRNPGGYQYKRGLGGPPIEQLGEWDWATSDLHRYVGNLLLARKQSGGQKKPGNHSKRKTLPRFYYAAARVLNSLVNSS